MPCLKHFASALLVSMCLLGEQIPVKEQQGAIDGFLLLRDAAGKVIALGDETESVRGDRIYSRLVFHFRDGSIDDETAYFTQQKVFRLLQDHHIQQGPSFPKPVDVSLDVPSGKVIWHEWKDGKDIRKTEYMNLPTDLANGLISLVVENFPREPQMTVSYLAMSSKPRVVKLLVRPDGQDEFEVGGFKRRAERFNVHIEIGGLAGMAASLVGKQPDDIKLWVVKSDVPTFIRMRGALYEGGPVWTMEQAAPTWAETAK
ncbi:MAG TPA: hypothetical protein VKX25_21950 [Bryobacteraceae bacterium]|nr:hypothetical protein [Bryobacteraceae bacterium]